jgi:hypothetical protein
MDLDAVSRALHRSSPKARAIKASLATILWWRRTGASLRNAAEAGGVHVATLCRWQQKVPELRAALAEAAGEGRKRHLRVEYLRPSVRWRKDCPLCRARVVVRKKGSVPFWRCGRYPLCQWASWRPRAPRDCPRCRCPRYWSHSRMSVVCEGCGLRTKRALTGCDEGDETWCSDTDFDAD